MDCIARQILLSMGFSRQEYWSGLPFPSPGEWIHLYIYMAEYIRCSPETITIFVIGYTPIQNEKCKKKKRNHLVLFKLQCAYYSPVLIKKAMALLFSKILHH